MEDLEQSEIRTMLLRLPFMDMRPVRTFKKTKFLIILKLLIKIQILAEAYNLRHETMERQLFEETEMQFR